MKKKIVKDISASVRARLLNLARSTGRDFQELTIRYTVERFLARLAESEHRERFILKGAMLYIPWKLDDKRTTMDLDLLGLGSPDMEKLMMVFQQICDTEIEDDGLIFNKESITVTQIREESVYDGVRIIVRVTLGSMPIRLQVDVGFGDQIVPVPQSAEFPQNEPIALCEDFFSNESKQSQWKGFIRKQRRLDSAPSLTEIIEVIRTFLLPIVFQIDTEVLTVATWSPEQGWTPKQ
jgi:hypothetical protein